MSFQRTIEYLSSFSHDKAMIGATLAGAAFHIIGQEIQATRADKEQVTDIPEIARHNSDAGDALFLVDIGLFQDVEKVKERLGPELAHMGPSFYFDHTSNLEASKSAELEIVRNEAGRRIVELSISRGGRKRIQMKADPAFRAERGPAELADFESVPLLWDHVDLRSKLMGWSALMLPDSHILAQGFARYMQNMQDEAQEAGEAFVRGTKRKDFFKVKGGVRGLRDELPDIEVVREAYSEQNVRHMIAVTALNDRVVRTKKSHELLQQMTGRVIPFRTDQARNEGDHAGIVTKPKFQISQIQSVLAGDFEPVQLEPAA